jgi:hypothetical protein
VDANSILVKPTYNGDTDLNGKVDADDYFNIDKGFSSRNDPIPLTGYRNGDFDYNGKIDSDDYFLIDKAFALQGPVLSGIGSAAVPEPGTLGLLSIAALGMMRRRRNARKI